MLKKFVQGLIVLAGLALFVAPPPSLSPSSAAADAKKNKKGKKYKDGKEGAKQRARDALREKLRRINRAQAAQGRSKKFETRQEKNIKRDIKKLRPK